MQTARPNFDIIEKHRYLIDYSNLKDGLFSNKKSSFCNEIEYLKYVNDSFLGIPFLLPNYLDSFDYSNNNYFTISKADISHSIFSVDNLDYVGVRLFTSHGNDYNPNATPKKDYIPFINWVSQVNNKCKSLVSSIRSSGKTVCAFQTRNIPHYGHERIIEEGLKKCDYVIINPIIGLKKKGDFRHEVVEKAFLYLIDNFYGERVKYSPIVANMFYAGPREAAHHAILRENIGFTHFIVGRDHAGAEGAYNSTAAYDLLSKSNFNISVMTLQGAYYCKKIKKAVIKGVDRYHEEDLVEISGSEFRDCIISGDLYNFSRPELQNYIKTLEEDLFE